MIGAAEGVSSFHELTVSSTILTLVSGSLGVPVADYRKPDLIPSAVFQRFRVVFCDGGSNASPFGLPVTFISRLPSYTSELELVGTSSFGLGNNTRQFVPEFSYRDVFLVLLKRLDNVCSSCLQGLVRVRLISIAPLGRGGWLDHVVEEFDPVQAKACRDRLPAMNKKGILKFAKP